MRLYLTIERNSLPPVKTVWPLPTGDRKFTTSDLLYAINAVFPLEAEQWGLEDYIVTLNGHECLHYHEIKFLCNDGDQLTIRPLHTTEIRARTISGRAQITSDGRHLVDGVAFGRAALRSPVRPDLHIPPRKRIRLDHEESVEVDKPTLLLTNGDHEYLEESDDDEEDGDFLDDQDSEEEDDIDSAHSAEVAAISQSSDGTTSDSSSDVSSEDEVQHKQVKKSHITTSSKLKNKTRKTVRIAGNNVQPRKVSIPASTIAHVSAPSSDGGLTFEQQMRSQASRKESLLSETSEASSDDSGTSNDSTSSDSDSDSDSDSSDSDSSDSDDDSASGSARPGSVAEMKVTGRTATSAAEEAESDETKLAHVIMIKGDVVQVNGIISKSNRVLPQKEPQYVGVPGEGKKSTRNRTQRKKESQRLKHLQTMGLLPHTANLKDLRAYENKPKTAIYDDSSMMDRVVDAVPGHEQTHAISEEVASDDGPEEQSSKLIDSETLVDVFPENNADSSDTSNRSNDLRLQEEKEVNIIEKAKAAALSMIPPILTRRPKLNVSASNRMVFGSLGVRVPRNDQEKLVTREKLAGQPSNTNQVSETSDLTQPNESQADYDEDWQAKIQLSAVDSGEIETELEQPPFPFEQRWHSRHSKKRKRRQQVYYDDEEEEEDYQLVDDNMMPIGHRYYDDPKSIASNMNEDVQVREASPEFDSTGEVFPQVPTIEQYQALPTAEEDKLDSSAYVVYSELACDASTGWQPSPVLRVIKLVAKLDRDIWRIEKAPRDLPRKLYDGDGNRLLGKFEMDTGSDEGSENELDSGQFVEVSLSELSGAKVLIDSSSA